jgi:hypothetical protein
MGETGPGARRWNQHMDWPPFLEGGRRADRLECDRAWTRGRGDETEAARRAFNGAGASPGWPRIAPALSEAAQCSTDPGVQ